MNLKAVLSALAFSVGAVACSSDTGPAVAEAGDFQHVHDLALDRDGALLAATHSGLYRVEAIDRAVKVWSEQHDLMSMAVLDSGELVASGHPNMLIPEYRVEGKPPHFGFIRSSDGGESWVVGEFLGEADFHAFVPTDDGLYAAESSGSIWFRDDRGEWQELGAVQARDLAASPDREGRLLAATDFEDQLWLSVDGAATWALVDDAPPLIELEWPSPAGMVGVDSVGDIWRAPEPAGPWVQAAKIEGRPETLLVAGERAWYVALEGGTILRSEDQGASWVEVYIPPQPI